MPEKQTESPIESPIENRPTEMSSSDFYAMQAKRAHRSIDYDGTIQPSPHLETAIQEAFGRSASDDAARIYFETSTAFHDVTNSDGEYPPTERTLGAAIAAGRAAAERVIAELEPTHPADPLETFVNEAFFKGIPADKREALRTAAKKAREKVADTFRSVKANEAGEAKVGVFAPLMLVAGGLLLTSTIGSYLAPINYENNVRTQHDQNVARETEVLGHIQEATEQYSPDEEYVGTFRIGDVIDGKVIGTVSEGVDAIVKQQNPSIPEEDKNFSQFVYQKSSKVHGTVQTGDEFDVVIDSVADGDGVLRRVIVVQNADLNPDPKPPTIQGDGTIPSPTTR